METMFKSKHTGIILKYPNRSFLQTNKYPSSFYSLFTKSPLEGDSRPASKKTSHLYHLYFSHNQVDDLHHFQYLSKKKGVTESVRGNYVFI